MMNAPARYQYDPRWEVIAFMCSLAMGLPFLVLVSLFPRTLGIAAGLIFAGFSVILTLRRQLFPRALVLDEEGVWIPSGFLRMKVRHVLFAEISDVWEVFLPRTVVLCLRCRGKTYEVYSLFLQDRVSYLAVSGFICSRVEASHG
jgi:hypothetical protein